MAGQTATVTSKGQITVPADIRRYMGIEEGDLMLFVREAGRVYVERVPGGTRSADLYGVLGEPGAGPLDVGEARAAARAGRETRHDSIPGPCSGQELGPDER